MTVLRPPADAEPPQDAEPDLRELGDHLLGRVDGDPCEVTVLIVGGLHGNEPAGVRAIRRVFESLRGGRLRLRCTLIGLAGNLPALRRGSRFVESDLNRMWGAGGREVEGEDGGARRTLLAHIAGSLERARGPVVLLDLHSTSSGGAPFTIVGDTPSNRCLADSLPVPVVLGLEESVEGTLLTYFGERGHAAIGFEGGAHEDPLTLEHHVAAIWLTLVACGALEREDLRDHAALRERLRSAAKGLPSVVEVRHRHPITPRDRFRMAPGLVNFGPVARGEVIAHDADGEIQSPADGLLLLPLYQGEGEDGFFIGRRVSRAALLVSRALRWLSPRR
ncbi:MAG: hypothetical protein CMJ84_08685 [Planctomycetes bacterium]|nr:hypothetical protein [Planctomycetota bacterium]MDP6410674.1 succinylglutamate desuccinylase/aspartoacylase family protein [Planctomycetota bacterium]